MSKREFDCTKCGNCCPKIGCHLVGNLCSVHPSIVGEKVANEQRGFGCPNPPWAIAGYWGFYCPPVLEAFQAETGIILHKLVQEKGDVVISEWTEEADKIRALRRFVGIESS